MKTQLVLIPGLMCDAAVWQPVLDAWPAVSQDAKMADHGHASSLPQMAQQILDSFAGPLALVGHSMGGRVALEVLRLAPERVRKIALLDTARNQQAHGFASSGARARCACDGGAMGGRHGAS
jgi:pimeloyl-ACP methyl ester carboxylesterase